MYTSTLGRIAVLLAGSQLALSSPVFRRDAEPTLPHDPNTTKYCTWWYDNENETSCTNLLRNEFVEMANFNPSVGKSCENFKTGVSYCVEAQDEPQTTTPPVTTTFVPTMTSTSTVPTSTKPPNGIETPQPTQPGMVDNCNKFYFVQMGDQCAAIASKHGITVDEFQKWNPETGNNCSGLWANAYVCVSIIGRDTTPVQPDNGIQTPTPAQPEMVSSCNKFHYVRRGQSCQDIANDNGITVADFTSWNSRAKADCSGLWADTYACVGLVSSYNFDAPEQLADWANYDGKFKVSSKALLAESSAGGKLLIKAPVNDVAVEASVRLFAQSGNAGFVFRASQPGNGADNFHGYYVGLSAESGGYIVLGRADGGWRQLARANTEVKFITAYKLRVEAYGEQISVFLNGERKISIRDGTYRSGMTGVRVYNVLTTYDDMTVTPLVYDGFEKNMVNWKIHDGGFDARTGQLLASKADSGKATLGADFADFVYDVDMSVSEKDNGGNAGVIFRASRLGKGPDAYNGYYAGLDPNGSVQLGRADGGWKWLGSNNMSIRTGQTYAVRIRASGDRIQVFVDDMNNAKIDVREGTFKSGAAGVRVFRASAKYDNMRIGKI